MLTFTSFTTPEEIVEQFNTLHLPSNTAIMIYSSVRPINLGTKNFPAFSASGPRFPPCRSGKWHF